MKTVYPEVVSLSYVNIPKTGNKGTAAHSSGVQLLIELQLTDSAAMSVNNDANSSSSPDAPGHSRSMSASNAQAGAASGAVPRAGLKGRAKASAAGGPSGAVQMAAILSEFERRLEKQVRSF